jgi:hypothetical protein
MRTSGMATLAAALICLSALSVAASAAEPATPYATMAPLAKYLITDRNAEIALARTAAPRSIAAHAEVLVLGSDGYSSASPGSNGFVCLVERAWAAPTDSAEFWNPKVRSPVCVNAPAARSELPIIMLRTKWALAGASKEEIAQKLSAAFDSKELPALEPNAMSYMMSRQQYLNDGGKHWHPHMMWFVPGDAADSWGANHPDSPPMASNVPEDRMTVFYVWVGNWSDGTPFDAAKHAMPAAHQMK